MKAVRVFYDKAVLPDGGIVEMVIWKVPEPVPPTTHGLKYRLFYGMDGVRIVGYDNERGKGDHRHIKGREGRYRFSTAEKLVADFLADVDKVRGESS
jgi:hypothetical protein